jgi:hypothetical protein
MALSSLPFNVPVAVLSAKPDHVASAQTTIAAIQLAMKADAPIRWMKTMTTVMVMDSVGKMSSMHSINKRG